MSQENVEVAQVAYEAFARGGLDQHMEHFSDDVDYRSFVGGPQDIGPIHGKDALRALLQEWVDMFDAGIIDPAKVTRNALQNAASIAGLMLTTEALIHEVPEKEKPAPAPHGGGMGGMY